MAHLQHWTENPDTRGSFDILWSCLSTLALCVWTAVHPNVQLRASWKRNLFLRVGMMTVAVVFPEMLISAAWRQRSTAKGLKGALQRLRTKQDDPVQAGREPHTRADVRQSVLSEKGSSSNKAAIWNDLQAFFTVMGGFAVRVRHENQTTGSIQDHDYLLTVNGLELLALAGHLPQTTSEEIEERSNADVIAKIIVLCQVAWFALQVLSRLIEGLPVTTLEAHTTIHVCCAIAMYTLWFSKPYNIDRSILLENTATQQIASLLVFREIWASNFQQRLKEYQSERERFWRDCVVSEALVADRDAPPSAPVLGLIDEAIEAYSRSAADNTPTTDSSERALRSLAVEAEAGLGLLKSRVSPAILLPLLSTTERPGVRQHADNYELRTVWGSWTSNTGHSWSKEKLINTIFNVLYGTGHLAAWNARLPTAVERWLWRGSGLMLVMVPVWGTLWVLWWKASTSNRKWLFPFRNGDLDIVGGPFFCLVIVAYTVARGYFLVESLVSLRALPRGAYEQVSWTKIFPHVS